MSLSKRLGCRARTLGTVVLLGLLSSTASAVPLLDIDFREYQTAERAMGGWEHALRTRGSSTQVGVYVPGWSRFASHDARFGLGVGGTASASHGIDGSELLVLRFGAERELGSLVFAGLDALQSGARVRAFDAHRQFLFETIVWGNDEGLGYLALNGQRPAIGHVVISAVGQGQFSVLGLNYATVPEPAGGMLVALGALMLGVSRRRLR